MDFALYFINFINIEKLEDFIIKADSVHLKIKITEKKKTPLSALSYIFRFY